MFSRGNGGVGSTDSFWREGPLLGGKDLQSPFDIYARFPAERAASASAGVGNEKACREMMFQPRRLPVLLGGPVSSEDDCLETSLLPRHSWLVGRFQGEREEELSSCQTSLYQQSEESSNSNAIGRTQPSQLHQITTGSGMSGTAASPGSTTGTESLGDSSGNLTGTETSSPAANTSPSPTTPSLPHTLSGSLPPGLSSGGEFGLVTSPPGAPSLPTPTVTGFPVTSLSSSVPGGGGDGRHHAPGFADALGLGSESMISQMNQIVNSVVNSPMTNGGGTGEQSVKCSWCSEPFRDPKVLACFHTFCKPCLEAFLESPGKIICPQCHAETQLCADLGVESLLSDYGLANLIQKQSSEFGGGSGGGPLMDGGSGGSAGSRTNSNRDSTSSASSPALENGSRSSPGSSTGSTNQTPTCTGCKSKESGAVSHCQDCANFLCANCVMAHQYMHCFEGHRIRDINEFDSRTLVLLAAASADRPVGCLNHRGESVRYFCFTCNIPICRECTTSEHPRGLHQFEVIQEVAEKQLESMQGLLGEAKGKQVSLVGLFKAVDGVTQRLRTSYSRASLDINDTANFLISLIEEQRQQTLRELETAHSSKQVSLAMIDKKLQQTSDKLNQTIEFMHRLLKYASPTEALVFKKLLETRLQVILNYPTEIQNLGTPHYEFQFQPPNTQSARSAIAATFGSLRSGATSPTGDIKNATVIPPTPIGRPPSRSRGAYLSGGGGGMGGGVSPGSVPIPTSSVMMNGPHPMSGPHPAAHAFSDSNLLQTKHDHYTVGSLQSLGTFSNFNPSEPPGSVGMGATAPFPYEKWSSGGSEGFAPNPPSALQVNTGDTGAFPPSFPSPDQDLQSTRAMSSLFPPRSQIKRHKMIYHCKFGEFGVMEGQFTEPSGVTVNASNDIIVADTNNHRIQVFDKEGRFKYQFGECGKRDGQLLYPNRVAVNRATGDIVVTERSPTHQIQVYNQYGQFLRKFGANILQHPRGVTVDSKGRIVVIECKVMRVLIFDMYGNILQKFSCSRYLEFPNGVCANDKQEIFISDNRAHCIKVFNYEGQFLRQLGGEGITNYPIGVGINHLGEVVVADNHNNFNLTIFQQDGTLVNALESKVKHAQCFDVALLEEGSVVLASKDYRLYLYRYMQNQPPFPM